MDALPGHYVLDDYDHYGDNNDNNNKLEEESSSRQHMEGISGTRAPLTVQGDGDGNSSGRTISES